MTTYDIEAYVEQCLESIAAQTLTDLEVLVVDDGSNDATPRLVAEFCARDARFVPVFLPENSPGGVATAANAGLDLATGRWVGFVDGDDFVEPTMFERLVDAAEAGDADLAMCDYAEVVDGTGQRQDPADAHRWAGLTEPCYELDVPTRKQVLRFVAVPWRKLYRRSLLEAAAIRFPVVDGFYEDNPFHWFAVLGARRLAVVPEVLCYHRVGRGGQTMASADRRLFGVFAHHDTIYDWLVRNRLLEVYEATLVGWVVSQVEWVSRRTPPELRRALFDTLVPIFARYSTGTVARGLAEANKGPTAQRLSAALTKREYGSFVRTLASRPGSSNPLVTAAFHLRHSGVQRTAVLTTRYLGNALRGSRASRTVGRLARTVRREPTHSDVMFGLLAVQRQLRGIEQHLGAIERRLGDERERVPDPQPRRSAD